MVSEHASGAGVSGGADIAVIGGGLAGLAAAWALGREHRVTLYERHGQPGFTASSVRLPVTVAAGVDASLRIDVPLRVFYPGYYPTLLALYAELGVKTEPISYATSFSGADGQVFFRYYNLLVAEQAFGMVSPVQMLKPVFRQVALGAWRFRRALHAAHQARDLGQLTLGEFVTQERFDPAFVDGLLLPMVCTIATCSA